MINDNILQVVGNTPLIKLNHLTDGNCADILVKVEGLNVGGSIKTRTALAMINNAEEKGLLNSNSIIVEPTSGNQGIGLALVCAVKGYKCKIIMPNSVSNERMKMVKHYGAEVIVVQDEGNIGEAIEKCVELAKKMAREDKNVFVPNQFSNKANLLAQRETGKEIIEQAGIKIDGFCAGIGTGGTISGIGQVLKENNPECQIWALEPERAATLSGGKAYSHLQMGIGDGIIPEILDQKIYDRICVVSDSEAILMARLLASKEGLACGITSGTNVVGAIELAKQLGKGKTVVTVLPDTAERYYSTILFNNEI